METRNTSARLRSSTLWVPGVLVVLLGVSIHTHVVGLHDQARLVADNAVACSLPIDLGSCTTQEAAFVPGVSREFAFNLVLRTVAVEEKEGPGPSAAAPFPDNAIAESLKTATFTVVWQLRSEGQNDVEGSISEKALYTRTQGDDIRYVFGARKVPLRAGRTYKLLAGVTGPSAVLHEFDPALLVETSSPLKGHPLERWRHKDTALLLFLGGSLIALGLSKRYSDRKRRTARLAISGMAETADDVS